jgi:hypothetical protein
MEHSTPKTLSAAIFAFNCGRRLPDLLADLDGVADEVIVVVDDGSSDDTLEVAQKGADKVLRFEHSGRVGPARMLPVEHASGDWILILEDDERLDGEFVWVLDDLLEAPFYTHYWLPRKWLASAQPAAYLRQPPWFPDWQLRLFRNDRFRVWHSGKVHSHYQVMGPGCFESRTALLHYERLLLTEEQRQAKLARYRALNPECQRDNFYGPSADCPLTPLEAPPLPMRPRKAKTNQGRVLGGLHQVAGRSVLPTWGATLAVDMPGLFRPGERITALVKAVNQGWLVWQPLSGHWPHLYLSYHLRDSQGGMIRIDGDRTAVGQVVGPGEQCQFLASFTAPQSPGEYLIEWDMVSEFECWFADCTSKTTTVPIQVRSAA